MPEKILIAFVTFFAFVIVAYWVRRKLLKKLYLHFQKISWIQNKIIFNSIKDLIFYLIIFTGGLISIEILSLSETFNNLFKKILISIFFILIIRIAHKLVISYLDEYHARHKDKSEKVLNNIKKFSFALCCVFSVLIVFEIWNLPTTPFLIILLTVSAILFLFFKEDFSNFISGAYFILSENIKKGDYIKLESGEEGEIKNISFMFIEIATQDCKKLLLPNSKISKLKIEIYRKPPKKALNPFRFYTRLSIKELTGLKAKNLIELLDGIKKVDDSIIFFHTHDFLEEYHYLTPSPSNEFALWVGYALNEPMLAEKLSNIDIFEFPTIGSLRNRLINIIEEHINLYGSNNNCREGQEFHFIKTVSVIIPTPYIAHTLSEFREILKKISNNSLFYHIYEAKLRLGKVANDFSVWLDENLGEKELAEKIMAIDPYMFSVEGMRTKIIELIDSYVNMEAQLE